MGHKKAIYFLSFLFSIAYIWLTGLVIAGNATLWLFLVLLSAPKPVKAIKGFLGRELPMNIVMAMKATAQTNTIFGFLLFIGLFISYFF